MEWNRMKLSSSVIPCSYGKKKEKKNLILILILAGKFEGSLALGVLGVFFVGCTSWQVSKLASRKEGRREESLVW